MMAGPAQGTSPGTIITTMPRPRTPPPTTLLALLAAAVLLVPRSAHRPLPAPAAVVVNPGNRTVAEESLLSLKIRVRGFHRERVRLQVKGLPPGARWDEAARRLTFRPDFIQGGRAWRVTVQAHQGRRRARTRFTLRVADTIRPPWPAVVSADRRRSHTRLLLRQTTDTYLDSPGYAGRTFEARVSVPNRASAARKKPVRLYLHAWGGRLHRGGSGAQFGVYPHDPHKTYWWGYSDQLPRGEPTKGRVPNYTQRRALHLLEWVLRTYPGADPERV